MSDEEPAATDRTARRLGCLIGGADAGPGEWSDADLADMFAQQLAAPVEVDLRGLPAQRAGAIHLLASARGLLVRSLHDLLHHPHPPVGLLEMTKDLAKACRNDPCSPLPAPVATALYYCIIATAQLRCERRISGLSDAALADGLAWVEKQPWIDAETRALVEEALAQVRR